ncbi:hypothetical protein [Streptomyces sp. NPDC005423]
MEKLAFRTTYLMLGAAALTGLALTLPGTSAAPASRVSHASDGGPNAVRR